MFTPVENIFQNMSFDLKYDFFSEIHVGEQETPDPKKASNQNQATTSLHQTSFECGWSSWDLEIFVVKCNAFVAKLCLKRWSFSEIPVW